MTTVVIRIELPPRGRLETAGNGSGPDAAGMAEENAQRDAFVDGLGPVFDAVLARPLHRSGNVSRVELLGTPTWSQLDHYLLLVEVDLGDPRLDLDTIAPRGSTVEVIGEYRPLRSWPTDVPTRSVRPFHTRPATRGFDTLEETLMTTPTTGPSTPGTSMTPTSHWWDSLTPPGGYYPGAWPPPYYPTLPGWPGGWGTDPTPPPPNGVRGVNGGPLSPDGFGEGKPNGTSTAVEPTPAGVVLSEADKAVLQRIRQVIAEARSHFSSTDAAEVANAKQRVVLAAGYTTGFLDGKGVRSTSPGLAAVLPSPNRSLEDILDSVDTVLGELTKPGTRSWGDFFSNLGARLLEGLADTLYDLAEEIRS